MSTITEFAEELYENSRAKGFYDHEDWLRSQVEKSGTAVAMSTNADPTQSFSNLHENLSAALAEHYGNRLLLIVGEAVEAHEELRAGRGVGELYFTDRHGNPGGHFENTLTGDRYKPEGVLPELAEIAIRSLETIAGILANLPAADAEKLRKQVPLGKHTRMVSEGNPYNGPVPGDVTVAEILNLKHEFNMSRAPKHGGKAF